MLSGARMRTAGRLGFSQVTKLACSTAGFGSSHAGGVTSNGTTNDVLAYPGGGTVEGDDTDREAPAGVTERAVGEQPAAKPASSRAAVTTSPSRKPPVVRRAIGPATAGVAAVTASCAHRDLFIFHLFRLVGGFRSGRAGIPPSGLISQVGDVDVQAGDALRFATHLSGWPRSSTVALAGLRAWSTRDVLGLAGRTGINIPGAVRAIASPWSADERHCCRRRVKTDP